MIYHSFHALLVTSEVSRCFTPLTFVSEIFYLYQEKTMNKHTNDGII